jgi:hypothetical protein
MSEALATYRRRMISNTKFTIRPLIPATNGTLLPHQGTPSAEGAWLARGSATRELRLPPSA